MKRKSLKLSMGAVFLLYASMLSYAQEKKANTKTDKPPYEGLIFKVNDDWKIKFSGLVNAFYTHTEQEAYTDHPAKSYNSIENGLNGALLIINPSYTLGKTVMTANFMFSLGINSHGLWGNLQITGFNFSSVDVRRASATISNTQYGSVTFGRDFGLLGLDAILKDITFLGVGANWSFSNPSYVTLAGIGYGYVFVDKCAQITYTSPTFFKSLSASLGIYQPYKFTYASINRLTDNTGSTNENPAGIGIHGKLSFTKSFDKKISLQVSAAISTQAISEYNIGNRLTSNNLRALGADVFANLAVGRFNVTGYYYYSNGMGSDGLQFRPIIEITPDNIQKVKSQSYYVQLVYKTSGSKPWLFGVIYGSSTTADAISGAGLVDGDVSRRFSGVAGYQINPYLALRAEYTIQTKGLFAPAPRYDMIAIGGTFYF